MTQDSPILLGLMYPVIACMGAAMFSEVYDIFSWGMEPWLPPFSRDYGQNRYRAFVAFLLFMCIPLVCDLLS